MTLLSKLSWCVISISSRTCTTLFGSSLQNGRTLVLLFWLLVLPGAMPGLCPAATFPATNSPALSNLANYFMYETALIRNGCLSDTRHLNDWKSRREAYRRQLFEMLSLDPLPQRSDLKATVTGKVEHESFTVENLHFQSLPGLYVTANLYLPKNLEKPAPTILYLSGHGPVVSNGISYGNKVAYQHHGAWFARNGYICLILDTLQLGEIQALHHGTYREKMWWWNSRGYTPAGVEAWNSIRALDYLETRPEVDAKRFGVTGRSGGGAYSWWIAALDERIKVAAPVAGITDLQNHVVDGAVEGHCDCMFTVNTYRWDYPQVAALVAPRPLLIVNSDSDTIFPLDGVMRLHGKVRQVYNLYGASTNLGIVIGPGPHKDTQDLQVPVFRWFNRFLKGADPVIEMGAVKFFAAHDLKVFNTLPADAINTNIQASFVPLAKTALPKTESDWTRQNADWSSALLEKTFAGWPSHTPALALEQKVDLTLQGLRLRVFDFNSQPHVRLRLYMLSKGALSKPSRMIFSVLNEQVPSEPEVNPQAPPSFATWVALLQAFGFTDALRQESKLLEQHAATNNLALSTAVGRMLWADNLLFACVAPRGLGLDAYPLNERELAHVRRRFMLLGQTLDSMRVWDIRRGMQALRAATQQPKVPIYLRAKGAMACNSLYAALFEPVAMVDLWQLPRSHAEGPDYLNVMRILDVPQAVSLACEHSHVCLHDTDPADWNYPAAVYRNLNWPARRLIVEKAR